MVEQMAQRMATSLDAFVLSFDNVSLLMHIGVTGHEEA